MRNDAFRSHYFASCQANQNPNLHIGVTFTQRSMIERIKMLSPMPKTFTINNRRGIAGSGPVIVSLADGTIRSNNRSQLAVNHGRWTCAVDLVLCVERSCAAVATDQ